MQRYLERLLSTDFPAEFKSRNGSDKIIEFLLEKYSEYGEYNPIVNPYSKYKQFFETGERVSYEKLYYYVRDYMNILAVLAVLFPDEQKYIDRLQDVIWAVCSDFTWVLPAHRHGDESMEDCITRIDLFAAETGASLSAIKYVLGNRLDDFIVKRIGYELDKRIVKAFSNRSFWWENKENNWAAVCGGYVGIVLMYEAPDVFKSVKPRLDTAIDSFLKSYYNDGICREGAAYWMFGFGSFLYYACELKVFSEGLCDYTSDSEKILNIAKYYQNCHIADGRMMAIADSTPELLKTSAPPYILKNIYGGEIKVYKSKGDFELRTSFYALASLLLVYDAELESEYTQNAETFYFQDSALFLKKTSRYSFYAKAGHNDEPHNHNDVGSFALNSDGIDLLCDIGRGVYNRKYFSESRYEIFCTSSLGHNVPYSGAEVQLAGEKYAGDMSLENDELTISFHKAYKEGVFNKLKRHFTFSEDEIILCDEFAIIDSSLEFTERFILAENPVIAEGEVKLNGCIIEYDAENWNVGVIQKNHYRRDNVYKYYCLEFYKKNNSISEFTMKVLIK